MLKPEKYKPAAFEQAWDNVLLYSEHTWGAYCSISGPERKETKEQWEIKRSYAEQADKQSRELLAAALAPATTVTEASMQVINTLSWARSGLVSFGLQNGGIFVQHQGGQFVPSQRLKSGELVAMVKDVPAMGTQSYKLASLARASKF